MKKLIELYALAGALTGLLALPAPAQEERLTGQWLAEQKGGDTIQLSLRYESGDHGFSNRSSRILREQLHGLSAAQIASSGTPVRFELRRDAGVFTNEGWFRDGKGSGHWMFSPNPAFAAELRRQGYGTPSQEQQFSLAMHDVGLALINELRSQGYERPTLTQFVRLGTHGVRLDYLREMRALGYTLGSVDQLIRMRDHGVTPGFIAGMATHGYARIPLAQLIRARDHGVTPSFVEGFKKLGYDGLSLEELIRLRDHGVTPAFVQRINQRSGGKLSIRDLIDLRDRGARS